MKVKKNKLILMHQTHGKKVIEITKNSTRRWNRTNTEVLLKNGSTFKLTPSFQSNTDALIELKSKIVSFKVRVEQHQFSDNDVEYF